MLKLIDPNEKYLEEYKEAYELSCEKIEQGLVSRHDQMFFNPDEVDVIDAIMSQRDESRLPEGWVLSYNYFAVDDDKFIGIINIRVKLTERLLKFGGHIGYGVNPKYWKMGYGTKMLALALEKYGDLIEEDKILITCDEDNIGSYKIIEANGGVLENIVEAEEDGDIFPLRRYWINKD